MSSTPATHFVESGHERVFAAVINGACLVSDESRYYLTQFEDKKDILCYTWTRLSALPDKLTTYLKNEQVLAHIAASGRAQAEQHHTWRHRALSLLELSRASGVGIQPDIHEAAQ